jgi:hypothetical protein
MRTIRIINSTVEIRGRGLELRAAFRAAVIKSLLPPTEHLTEQNVLKPTHAYTRLSTERERERSKGRERERERERERDRQKADR